MLYQSASCLLMSGAMVRSSMIEQTFAGLKLRNDTFNSVIKLITNVHSTLCDAPFWSKSCHDNECGAAECVTKGFTKDQKWPRCKGHCGTYPRVLYCIVLCSILFCPILFYFILFCSFLICAMVIKDWDAFKFRKHLLFFWARFNACVEDAVKHSVIHSHTHTHTHTYKQIYKHTNAHTYKHKHTHT
jgi:hypothetical protein